MVQQLFNEMKEIKDEIKRLKGVIRSISVGGQIIPGAMPGSASVPAATDGALIRGNATPGWERLEASIPGAGFRNAVILDNGDVRPSWKATLDNTNPTTISSGDSPSSGTSLIYARRDHRHGVSAIATTFYIPFGSDPNEGQDFTPV